MRKNEAARQTKRLFQTNNHNLTLDFDNLPEDGFCSGIIQGALRKFVGNKAKESFAFFFFRIILMSSFGGVGDVGVKGGGRRQKKKK